ncbi:MAG: hypothetical protein KAU38_01160, partial [Desulfobacterales bacterium]|nr:hypothetical protein [Desulfobacterales bacterium]
DSFFRPSQYVLFAKVNIQAQDDRSAGFIAKGQLEDSLDLIRFELEHDVVTIHQSFLAIRHKTRKARMYRLPAQIPNPKKNVDKDEFKTFVAMTEAFVKPDRIKVDSYKKIRSALRYYRMGSDSERLENKLTNWWTGIEYLSRTESKSGGIVQSVESKLVPTLLLSYVTKHLDDIKSTLGFCRIGEFTSVSSTNMFSLLRRGQYYKDIQDELSGYPLVGFSLNYFTDKTKNAASLKDFLEKHEKRLRWHIHRIWRVRCDIVHSAEYSIGLTLLCANLEYYLKSLLTAVIDQWNRNPRMESLEEFFERSQFTHTRLMQDLKQGEEKSFMDILDEKPL